MSQPHSTVSCINVQSVILPLVKAVCCNGRRAEPGDVTVEGSWRLGMKHGQLTEGHFVTAPRGPSLLLPPSVSLAGNPDLVPPQVQSVPALGSFPLLIFGRKLSVTSSGC